MAMDAGLQVRLNPRGGNRLNVREALRVYLTPSTVASEQAEQEQPDDNDAELEPRRVPMDDYDLDDDFIDDGEVFEDEVPTTPNYPHPDHATEDHDATDVEQDDAVMTDAQPPESSPVYPGFASFWLNRGDLPRKKDISIRQPPSALGNVIFDHLPALNPSPDAHAAVPMTPPQNRTNATANTATVDKRATTNAGAGGEAADANVAALNAPSAHAMEGGAGADATKNPALQICAAAAAAQPGKGKGGRSGVQPPIVAEIGKLFALCQSEFGDKKPKLNDPKVQEQLDSIFRAAIACGAGKLFSDIGKDRRVVALADDVWNRLSFLRVKRANLETLGHALIWSAKEKEALRVVETCESLLETLMRERRSRAGGDSGNAGTLVGVTFDGELDEKIYAWYRAKAKLQAAKNQLGSRVKSVKKCVSGWVTGLKKSGFQGWSVGESEIADAFRRVEEERAASERARREAERSRRELERVEKKRRREEVMAAATAAAKRVAMKREKEKEKEKDKEERDGASSKSGGNVGVPKPKAAGTGGSQGGNEMGRGKMVGTRTGDKKVTKGKVGIGKSSKGMVKGVSKGRVTKAGVGVKAKTNGKGGAKPPLKPGVKAGLKATGPKATGVKKTGVKAMGNKNGVKGGAGCSRPALSASASGSPSPSPSPGSVSLAQTTSKPRSSAMAGLSKAAKAAKAAKAGKGRREKGEGVAGGASTDGERRGLAGGGGGASAGGGLDAGNGGDDGRRAGGGEVDGVDGAAGGGGGGADVERAQVIELD